jgi:1-acyl-sn-glycerol-3-phosphate acyltransferase/nucleoside-diphosphate-sugar epimerase
LRIRPTGPEDGGSSESAVLVSRRDRAGALLAERLAKSPAIGSVLTIEAPAGADRYAAALAGAPVAVYRPPLAAKGPGPDLDDARAVFAACRAVGVGRVILVGSAAVCEPSHQHAGLTPEPRSLPPRPRNRLARRWVELEALATREVSELAGAALTILRAAPLACRDSGELLPRLVAARLAPALAGYDPSVQLLAPEDLAEAVARAIESERPDPSDPTPAVYQIVPRGTVPVRAAIRLAGGRQVRIPWSLQRLARAALAPLGWAAHADELAYARYPATVSGAKAARELGFTPRHTSAEAVLAMRRDASAPISEPAAAAPDFDPYGMDRGYIDAYGRTLFRFLHDRYWRVEWRGLEHVPREGRAVLAGVHRGFMPFDGCMLLHLVARELGRYPRFLIHPCLVKPPFLANYMTKLGGILACQENADFVLAGDELLGMFPEGIHGAFTLYRDAYRLGKFGRDEYVKMALRNRAPIVPFVTVGSAEIFPILGRVRSRFARRVLEWPFLPLGPNFPFPGLPLPSKWHTRFLAPLPVHRDHPPEAADDPAVVAAIGREVRARMEEAIAGMLARRRSIFFGSVFEPVAAAGEG